jgi:S1-C subfamily serine protease
MKWTMLAMAFYLGAIRKGTAMKLNRLFLTLGLVASIVALTFGLSIAHSAQAQGPTQRTPAPTQKVNLPNLARELLDSVVTDPETQILRDAYSRVNPSVVSITVRMPVSGSDLTTPFQNGGLQPYASAAGSGFVYDNAGHIVTNAHVVDNAQHIEVTFSDGTMMHAKIVGIDRDSDIAVIQAEGDTSHYQPVPLADSDKVSVGDLAIAIGNPFEQSGTMTHGIVSGLHRTVSALTQVADGSGTYTIPDAIQTDAAINPGNSGGPLLNSAGQVIGVNEQIESQVRQSSGVSFAIPSNIVKLVADALIKDGKIEHTWLGIAGTNLTLDLDEAMKLPAQTRGVYVADVQANSPASKAGLKAGNRTADVAGEQMKLGGDVIIAIDKQPVKVFDDLTAYLFINTHVGQKVTLTVLRDGQQQDVTVTLVARPQTQSKA